MINKRIYLTPGWLVLLFIVSSQVYSDVNQDDEPNIPTPTKQKVQDQLVGEHERMKSAFDMAITRYGEDYLTAERTLLGGGEPAKRVLRMNANHPDPLARLIANCLLRWMEGKAPEYQQALEYLEYIPKRIAMTPARFPQVPGVANDLGEQFGVRVADFLSLRLLKGIDWPGWKTFGILLYLQEQAQSSTTTPLIRFAVESPDPQRRTAAIDVIYAIQDPDIAAKIGAERRHAAQQGKKFPAELEIAPH